MKKNKIKKQNSAKKNIPFLWKNLRYLKEDLTIFWKPIAAVVAIYGLVYAFIVIGFNFIIPGLTNSTSTGVLASEQNQDSLTKLFDNISSSVSFVAGDQASSAVQFVLFILGFMALVSILRKTRKLGSAKASQAYFDGTGQFVSITLLLLIFFVFLVPLSIGSTILLAGISFASTAAESLGIWLVFSLLALLSIWLYAKYWPAVYIATLPGIRPIFALKQAAKLTKGYRINIFLQFLGFSFLASMALGILFIPIGIWLPVIAPYWLYFILLILFAASISFGFTVYRSLVDD